MARLAFYTQTYNAEKYVAKSIESVLDQTFTDFVYYIVDDASSDGTVDIIKDYAKKDNRIVPYFSQENKIMDLYNEYLEKITQSDAEFICWLDNDDWYEPEFAEEMIFLIDKYDADVTVCSTVYLDENTNNIVGNNNITSDSALIKREEYGEQFTFMHVFLRPVWGKLLRLSVFRNNSMKFRTDLDVGCDTVFILDFMRHTDRIYISDKILHNYLVRRRSISRSFSQSMLEGSISLHIYTTAWLNDMNANTLLNRAFLASVLLNAVRYNIMILISYDMHITDKLKYFCDTFTNNWVVEQLTFFCSLRDIGSDWKKKYDEYRIWLWDTLRHFPPDDSLNKIVQMLIDQDVVMSNVKENQELLKCQKIVGLLVRDDYEAVGMAIRDEIISASNKDKKLAFTLMDLCTYIAAFNEDAGLYILAKKYMLEYYLNNKDIENFNALADELDELIPNDADVAEMKTRI